MGKFSKWEPISGFVRIHESHLINEDENGECVWCETTDPEELERPCPDEPEDEGEWV